ncbi:hypothetical protein VB711_11840 [Cronbergia sp. UHCC 0137]|uniref:hypothetical protein n=1 Tax=Cronbergia sp. UHCC 0137 TaxID=3110239 RepID=UPI002B1F220C|nr:hypothetical protein [Cronbergia sp. UHCC 0137]MEA5618522.1 hypothetical protein [Cronbergia sp. UHCC 0137]
MRRRLTYGSILLLSLLIITIWWPVNDSNCSLVQLVKVKNKNFQVQATEVVVKPWLGEHHVYGIFMIPDVYKQTPFFVLSVPGNRQYCSTPFGYSENYDDVFAEPGTHLVRYYVKSRSAIQLILQGLYSRLNDKQNWTLTFPIPKANQDISE